MGRSVGERKKPASMTGWANGLDDVMLTEPREEEPGVNMIAAMLRKWVPGGDAAGRKFCRRY